MRIFLDRHAQLLRRRLCQLAPRTLPGIDFAGENRNRAVVRKMKPRRKRRRRTTAKTTTAPAAPAPLREHRHAHRRDQHTAAEHLHEAAPIERRN